MGVHWTGSFFSRRDNPTTFAIRGKFRAPVESDSGEERCRELRPDRSEPPAHMPFTDEIGNPRELSPSERVANCRYHSEATMNGLIYLIGLIVVIMFILSFLGLR
jgi:hypothetical protein